MTFDPLADERVAPNVLVPRSDSGNPLIVPRGETEAVEYTRASGLADYIVRDIFALKNWEERYIIHWLAQSPDLLGWAASVPYSTGPFTGTLPISTRQANAKQLDEIKHMVLERGRIHEAANAGSAVHAATVPGAPVVPMHELLKVAVEKYHELTAGLERVASEVFVVCDELRVAGTFDSGYMDPDLPGCVIVGDTKTGKSIHQGEFEIQLASYAHGEIYLGAPVSEGFDSPGEDAEEVFEHQRLTFEEFFGVPANLDVGYLVHVPLQGKPKPRIVELDLRRGWANAQAAARIRDDRAAFDKIGIGKKVDHAGKARRAMEEAYDDLWNSGVEGEQFRERALALHARFSHIWPQQYTDDIKRRLS